MKPNSNRLWYVVLVLGWLFDFLFWKKAPGINFALFTTLCLIGGFYVLLADGFRPHRDSLILIPLIGIFAAVTFVRMEPMTLFLGYTFALFAMSVLAVTYLGGRWLRYSIADYFNRFLYLLGSLIVRPLTFSSDIRKTQVESGEKTKRNLWPILRGLVIALPVVAIFASLLASADLVFSQKLNDFIELFNLEKLPEYIFRLVYILIGAYALAGVFLHAASQSKDEKLIGEDKPALAAFLGFTESSIVLGSVVILFAAFVAVQFRYFFGGQTNIHIEGYTYSEYARRGFGELVAVAFFSLLMLFSLSAVTRRETETQRRVFSGLGVGLVVLLLVMLVSAYQRLVLYEAAYGFSRLRTYTHVFLIWIGLLLVATIVLEILRRERLFAIATVIASFGFAVSLPVLNVDAFIVQQNIARELRGGADSQTEGGRAALDSQYFTNLSDDAVPPLVSAFQAASMPASVREEIGASLACIRYFRDDNARGLSWQSLHLSRYHADQALISVKSILDEYAITDTDWPVMVSTPAGEEFSCREYYYD